MMILRWITILFLGAGIGVMLVFLFALGQLVRTWARASSSLRFTQWLMRKWQRQIDPGLLQDYQATYSTASGQRVLQHQLDQVYCTVYEGHDPIEAAFHNGRRSVIHDTLLNLDYAEQPDKYQVRQKEGEYETG